MVLRHRNARLKDLTVEELVEVEEWMIQSHIIDAEGQKIDVRAWRKGLKPMELLRIVNRVEQDLERATRMKENREGRPRRTYQKLPLREKCEEVIIEESPNRQKRRGIIEDSDDD